MQITLTYKKDDLVNLVAKEYATKPESIGITYSGTVFKGLSVTTEELGVTATRLLEEVDLREIIRKHARPTYLIGEVLFEFSPPVANDEYNGNHTPLRLTALAKVEPQEFDR